MSDESCGEYCQEFSSVSKFCFIASLLSMVACITDYSLQGVIPDETRLAILGATFGGFVLFMTVGIVHTTIKMNNQDNNNKPQRGNINHHVLHQYHAPAPPVAILFSNDGGAAGVDNEKIPLLHV